ncbi:zinc finger CCCH domain-containing protein 20 [Mercurialis annua]|uniref:zinc finger CCCH domain-containing protein 20 n=1 Tax=Mercurialis annua TaxID=3986 RepID=UPI00215F3464|nr:zinc finger CCCH domain-containing protein 20 [Mercurialis annua]
MPVILHTISTTTNQKKKNPSPLKMMLGERHRISVPPWSLETNPDGNAAAASDYNPYCIQEALTALQRYLPSNEPDVDSDSEFSGLETDSPVDAFSCDHFRMFEFKVRRCARGRSHDWTECPYAHPGEKARRRDPRKYHYSGTACPEFRKGNCRKGDGCEFAHGVFECWLHPGRYRTQPCKDGPNCRRRVCFFAHTPEQLRVLPQQSPRSVTSVDSYDGSPLRQAMEAAACVKSLPFLSSPSSISPPGSPQGDSPPMSPMMSRSLGSNSVNEMVASLRNLQLGKMKSLPPSWNVQVGFGSPRSGSVLRPGFSSLPTTPTSAPTRPGLAYRDMWENISEEPAMERVESGRGLRAKMFEKLSKENSLGRADPDPGQSSNTPDVGWVSDLVM